MALSVSVDKNSLNKFWREGRELGEAPSFRALSELFLNYLNISLTLLHQEDNIASFEETLKNIELKTRNIVKVEEPPRTQKIKSEPIGELLGSNISLRDDLIKDIIGSENVTEKKEDTDTTVDDKEHVLCLGKSCNKESCERFSMKVEPPDTSQSIIPLKQTSDTSEMDTPVSNIKREELRDCSVCGFRAASFWTLKVHMEMMHLMCRWHCSLCGYNTKEKYIIRKHLKTSHHQNYRPEYMSYECGMCRVKGAMTTMKDHITVHHPQQLIFYQFQDKIKAERGPTKCRFCSKMFENKTVYKSHLESSHMSLDYSCKVCGYTGTNRLSMRKHIARAHTQSAASRDLKRFVRDNMTRECTHCAKPLLTKDNLEDHILSNHPDKFSRKARKILKDPSKLLHCNFCDFSSSMKGTIRAHVMSSHIKAVFRCGSCSLQCKNLTVLKKHLRSEHGSEDTTLVRSLCGSCNVSTSSLAEFKAHLKENHHPYVKNDQSKAKRGKLNKVKIKKKEIKVEHDKLPTFSCKDCSVRTQIKSEIIEHVIENHDIDEEEENDDQFEEIIKKIEVQCLSCCFSGSFSEYTDHLTGPQGTVMLCSLCGSHAKDEKDLADHFLVDHRDCKYSCSKCEFRDSNRRKVILHSKENHAKATFLYSCGFCSFKASQYRMTEHIEEEHKLNPEIKTEVEQLLQCQYCDYKHISKDRLETHINRFHKIYKCKDCKEEFCKRKRLEYHIQKNHQNFTFDCDKCDFKTKHESALYRHSSSIHLKVEPLPCGDCGRNFKRKDNLAVHIRKVHGK